MRLDELERFFQEEEQKRFYEEMYQEFLKDKIQEAIENHHRKKQWKRSKESTERLKAGTKLFLWYVIRFEQTGNPKFAKKAKKYEKFSNVQWIVWWQN